MTDLTSPVARLNRINRLYKVLSDSNRAIVRSGNETELFSAVCRVTVEAGQLLMAAVLGLDNESGSLRALAHWGAENGYFADVSIEMDDARLKYAASATAIRTGRPDVCNDLAADARMEPWRRQTASRGFRSCASFPLVVGGEKFGAFVIFAAEPGYFQDDEIELLSTVAQDVSFALGHLRDAHARRTAQSALADADRQLSQKDALLRIAGKVAQVGGWAVDYPSGHVFWSDEVFEILEHESRELPPVDKLLELYPEPHRTKISAALEACIFSGTAFDLEVEINTARGRLIGVRVCGEARRGVDGRIEGVHGAFQDVSVRRLQDEAQRRSEGHFRRLFDHTVDGVLLTRPDGSILAANRSACAIFGMDEDSIKSAGRAGLVDTTDPRLAGLIAARERDGSARGELRMRRAGGDVFEAELSSVIFDDDGAADLKLTGIFVRDLTESKRAARQQEALHEALRQAYMDLEHSQQAMMQQERLRAVGQMASGVAHDINNAISPVALYTEALLENEPGLSERARGYLETIQRSMGDVASTVGRMREFSRPPEAGNRTQVSVNLLVSQVYELTRVRWRDMAQREGVSISVSTDAMEGLPEILGAESEIREALTNLVFNAIDSMPRGGSIVMRTGIHEVAHGVRQVFVEVRDTGIGMDEQTRRRCLEPFFTTKGERGTGLGLAMVYGAVQRHGGDIRIDSAPGSGTAVQLLFPVTAGAVVGPPDIDSMHAPSVAPAALRILLVDDEALVLRSLENILQIEGHDVVSSTSGQEGLNLFHAALGQERPYQVVVTDLGMPDMDGRQVAMAVKAASPATPVILLTGWGQHLVEDGGHPANVDQVLGKPPRLAQLRAALARYVQASQAGGPGA